MECLPERRVGVFDYVPRQREGRISGYVDNRLESRRAECRHAQVFRAMIGGGCGYLERHGDGHPRCDARHEEYHGSVSIRISRDDRPVAVRKRNWLNKAQAWRYTKVNDRGRGIDVAAVAVDHPDLLRSTCPDRVPHDEVGPDVRSAPRNNGERIRKRSRLAVGIRHHDIPGSARLRGQVEAGRDGGS